MAVAKATAAKQMAMQSYCFGNLKLELCHPHLEESYDCYQLIELDQKIAPKLLEAQVFANSWATKKYHQEDYLQLVVVDSQELYADCFSLVVLLIATATVAEQPVIVRKVVDFVEPDLLECPVADVAIELSTKLNAVKLLTLSSEIIIF